MAAKSNLTPSSITVTWPAKAKTFVNFSWGMLRKYWPSKYEGEQLLFGLKYSYDGSKAAVGVFIVIIIFFYFARVGFFLVF